MKVECVFGLVMWGDPLMSVTDTHLFCQTADATKRDPGSSLLENKLWIELYVWLFPVKCAGMIRGHTCLWPRLSGMMRWPLSERSLGFSPGPRPRYLPFVCFLLHLSAISPFPLSCVWFLTQCSYSAERKRRLTWGENKGPVLWDFLWSANREFPFVCVLTIMLFSV